MLNNGAVFKLLFGVFITIIAGYIDNALCMDKRAGKGQPIRQSDSHHIPDSYYSWRAVISKPIFIDSGIQQSTDYENDSGYEGSPPSTKAAGVCAEEKAQKVQAGQRKRKKPQSLTLEMSNSPQCECVLSPGSNAISEMIEKIKRGEACHLGIQDGDGCHRYIFSLNQAVAVKQDNLSGRNRDVLLFGIPEEPFLDQLLPGELSAEQLSEYFQARLSMSNRQYGGMKRVVVKLSNAATDAWVDRYSGDDQTTISMTTYQQARRDAVATLWLSDWIKSYKRGIKIFVPRTSVAIVSGREFLAQVEGCSEEQFMEISGGQGIVDPDKLAEKRKCNVKCFNNGKMLKRIQCYLGGDSSRDVPVFVVLQEHVEVREAEPKDFIKFKKEIDLLKTVISDFNEKNNLLIDKNGSRVVLLDVEDQTLRPFEMSLKKLGERKQYFGVENSEQLEKIDRLVFKRFEGLYYRAFHDRYLKCCSGEGSGDGCGFYHLFKSMIGD